MSQPVHLQRATRQQVLEVIATGATALLETWELLLEAHGLPPGFEEANQKILQLGMTVAVALPLPVTLESEPLQARAALVDRLMADYDEWAHPHLVETRHDGEFTYYEPDVEAIVDRVLDALGLAG